MILLDQLPQNPPTAQPEFELVKQTSYKKKVLSVDWTVHAPPPFSVLSILPYEIPVNPHKVKCEL
jgi:hypothetical protein